MPGQPKPVLGERFIDAVAYAVELHAKQARKGTTFPYLTHLLAVCSLVLEDGGTEDEAIAALLHDGPEDQGGEPILAEIQTRFGEDVAAMVEGLSDSLKAVGEDKEPWRPRKERYLERLASEPESVLRVALADKIHNARSMAVDDATHGASPSGIGSTSVMKIRRGTSANFSRTFKKRIPESRNLPEFESSGSSTVRLD